MTINILRACMHTLQGGLLGGTGEVLEVQVGEVGVYIAVVQWLRSAFEEQPANVRLFVMHEV
jgi:hypothetical protein